MHIKRKIIVRAKPRLSNAERLGLFVRFTMQGERREIALGISIDIDRWDNTTKSVVSGTDAPYINQCIAQSKQTLEAIVTRYELIEKRIPTMDEVVEEYNEREGRGYRNNKKEETPAYESISKFIKNGYAVKGWSDSTAKKFHTLQQHLKQWNAKLTFAEIDNNTLNDFQAWCGRVLNHRNTTLQKQSKFLRWWLAWAKDNGLYKGNADAEYRPQFRGGSFEYKTIIYLEREELHRLMDYDFSQSPYLEHARDIFVFACFCGLRYSDVKKLKKTDIKNGNICVVTQKTTEPLQIPINQQAGAILQKYGDIAGRFALPVPSNQKINVYIKECCQLAGIDAMVTETYFKGGRRYERVCHKWECISFHASRRTFITMAFELGIPAEVIMKFSGHKKIEMLKPYMAIVEQKKKQEMAKFDNL